MILTPDDLRDFRKRAGLSQMALAKIIPCQVSTVASWEQGRKLPRGLYLARLLKVMDSYETKEGEKLPPAES